MKLKDFQSLFIHELKDLYSAEKQLTRALPKMAKGTENPKLKKAFESHLKETEKHVERLEQIFEQLEASPRGQKCNAMEGLIEEGESLLEEVADPEVLDAALIGAAQRVEHYEIAGYGCARTYAELLGHTEIAELLQKTLDEEGAANKKLTEIAQTVNSEAMASAE